MKETERLFLPPGSEIVFDVTYDRKTPSGLLVFYKNGPEEGQKIFWYVDPSTRALVEVDYLFPSEVYVLLISPMAHGAVWKETDPKKNSVIFGFFQVNIILFGGKKEEIDLKFF